MSRASASFRRLQMQGRAEAQGAREEPGKIARLFVEMHRGEDQLDGPFGGEPFGLERVGEAEAADREIGPRGAAAFELQVHVLTFCNLWAFGQKIEIGAENGLVQVGGADLEGLHAAFAGEKAGQRNFKLAVGEEEYGFAGERFGGLLDRAAGAGTGRVSDGIKTRPFDTEFLRESGQPCGRALLAER